jgi:hypothetical protein
MAGYYDIVLGLIPLSLAGLTALLLAAGMSLSVSIPLASMVTVGLMGHAMFVNAPVASVAGDGDQTGDATPQSNGVTSD